MGFLNDFLAANWWALLFLALAAMAAVLYYIVTLLRAGKKTDKPFYF